MLGKHVIDPQVRSVCFKIVLVNVESVFKLPVQPVNSFRFLLSLKGFPYLFSL